jgi:membrane associated rhomboid family serine protease
MYPPPPLGQFQRYPITTFVAVLAIVATLRSSFGANINPMFLSDKGDCLYEPWRLLTSTLFHGDPLHLIFNLYWLWVFGTLVEDRFGHGTTLGIFCFLAIGSQAAELAIFRGGIGLSGVNYGLFGMLWVLSSRDVRFRGAVDRQTVQLMVGWFFLCILLTITNTWAIANVAHGAGCGLGALLGWSLTGRDFRVRLGRAAIMLGAFLLCIVGGTSARPYVNFSGQVGDDYDYRACQALEKGNNKEAAALYETAVAIDPNRSRWWNNLGIAYLRLGRRADAARALQRADVLRPPDHNAQDKAEATDDQPHKTP